LGREEVLKRRNGKVGKVGAEGVEGRREKLKIKEDKDKASHHPIVFLSRHLYATCNNVMV